MERTELKTVTGTLEDCYRILDQAAGEYLENNYCSYEKEGDYYYVEIFVDYNDYLPDDFLHGAEANESPEDAFYDWLTQAEISYSDYNSVELKKLTDFMTDEDEALVMLFEDEAQQWLWDHVSFHYPTDHFLSQPVQVNLMLATEGEADRDMGEYNIFNFFGSALGYLSEDTALVWLADQMGKKKDLFSSINRFIEDEQAETSEISDSQFVQTAIAELLNNTHCMGGLVFLLEMPFSDFIKLKSIQNGQKDHPDKTIKIKKEKLTCGIFNPWIGGGSVLGIELDQDITVPASLIWDAWIDGSKMHGCDVDEVYGLVSSAWKPNLVLPEA